MADSLNESGEGNQLSLESWQYTDAIRSASRNKNRTYPGRDDPRCRDDALFPALSPKFKLEFSDKLTAFTIGSCFARNIEEALLPFGVNMPTRRLKSQAGDRPGRPNAALNEYNPGCMAQRIMYALEGKAFPDSTIVAAPGGHVDLMLAAAPPVNIERVMERRGEIDDIYKDLQSADLIVITLGLVEAWYDHESRLYLNQMPPTGVARASPGRYELRRLSFDEALGLLQQGISALLDAGRRVLLTVSPVPLLSTFSSRDCVIANEYSKAMLRTCAEVLCCRNDRVDFFPSYEIVRSMGLAAYMEDNSHVYDAVVRKVTGYMVESYRE